MLNRMSRRALKFGSPKSKAKALKELEVTVEWSPIANLTIPYSDREYVQDAKGTLRRAELSAS